MWRDGRANAPVEAEAVGVALGADEKRSALHVPAQRAAMQDAARCTGQRSVLHRPSQRILFWEADGIPSLLVPFLWLANRSSPPSLLCLVAIKPPLFALLKYDAVDRQNAAGEDPARGDGRGDERWVARHIPFPGA